MEADNELDLQDFGEEDGHAPEIDVWNNDDDNTLDVADDSKDASAAAEHLEGYLN